MESRTNVLTFEIKPDAAAGDTTDFSTRWRSVIRDFAGILAALLGPAAVIAYVFAGWRLAADIGWSAPFVIPSGFFSHWIVWFSLGLTLTVAVTVLKRPAAAIPS